MQYIYCDNSGIGFEAATAFNRKNPRCQVIYNSQKLEKWWSTLPAAWKDIFVRHAGLQKPVTKEQLHKLLLIKKLDLHGNTAIHSLQPLKMLIQLKELNISGTSVSGLEPLASVRTLRRLDVSHTKVRSLEPLQKLQNLQTINVENTDIRDLTPLSGNKRLKLIWADGTKVTGRNVASLRKKLPECLVLYQTPQLTLWWNNLEKPWQEIFTRQFDLDSPPAAEQLQKLVNSQKITISNHLDIDNAEPLAVFEQLQSLQLDNTGITDITPVVSLKNLKELSVTNSPLWDISPLGQMKQLEVLSLENTSVEDLSPLEKLHQLQKLNISGTKVKNLKPLSGLVNLRELVMNNTRVSTLKYIMPLSRLTLLRCDHTLLRTKKVENFKRSHPKTKVIFY